MPIIVTAGDILAKKNDNRWNSKCHIPYAFVRVAKATPKQALLSDGTKVRLEDGKTIGESYGPRWFVPTPEQIKEQEAAADRKARYQAAINWYDDLHRSELTVEQLEAMKAAYEGVPA